MTIYFDTETTGLSLPKDEILEIGILDDQGRALVDSLVRPVNHSMWPGAQAIHGISPADVANAPTLDELKSEIIEAVKDRVVVIYNAVFDSRFCQLSLSMQQRSNAACSHSPRCTGNGTTTAKTTNGKI